MMAFIPFVIDCDHTLCDGVYYPSMERRFNLRDGLGISLLKNRTNIFPIIMSGESDESIAARARKLDVMYSIDVQDKREQLQTLQFKKYLGLSNKYIAISDDIPDLELLQNATLSFCPADAEDEIKSIDGIIVLTKKGGEGCVREAINMILTQPWIKELFTGALQIT